MGPFLIIFGTRGVTYTAGEGEFHCPDCGKQPYRHRRVRRFFTLYFIPLIPLDMLGEYIECGRCEGTYKLEVLQLDPDAGRKEFQAEFHAAVKRTLALMSLADGHVDDAEVKTIADIYGSLTDRAVSEDEVRNEIEQARRDGRDVSQYLGTVGGMLNEHGKEMVVRAAVMVAAADGTFQDEEKVLLAGIAKALQMSSAHFNGVLSSMLEAPDSQDSQSGTAG